MQQNKNAIALLLTVMFVIVISVALGYGLKSVKKSAKVIESEKFLYQNSLIVEDVLRILKESPDFKVLRDDNATTELYMFLSSSSYIPLEMGNMQILISFVSARAKFNPNQLYNNSKEIDAFKHYVQEYMVDNFYVDILLDNMKIITQENRYDGYNSAIFDKNPELFREYVASSEHLKKINNYYKVEYNNENINKIDFKNLFYYSKDRNTSIDLNYATPEVWKLLLGVDTLRAEALSSGSGSYSEIGDLGLSDEEKESLKNFKTSFYEPYLYVNIEVMSEVGNSQISFEYDIKKQKGYGFVFKI
ncbi:hypothetical protein [Sulfurimonas sp.]